MTVDCGSCEATALIGARVPLRDGLSLGCNVILPPGAGKAWPAILCFSPYGITNGNIRDVLTWPRRGFAYVAADCRGRFTSRGAFVPWVNEVADAADLLAWIAAQPWSNGRVGMVGGSYVGGTQLAAAAGGHPALAAAAPSAIQGDLYGLYHVGGAPVLKFQAGWHIGMTAAPGQPPKPVDWPSVLQRLPPNRLDEFASIPCPSWKAVCAHPGRDAFWKGLSLKEAAGRSKAGFFLQNGWFDNIGRSFLSDFGNNLPGPHSCLRVGPWGHGVNMKEGELDYGPGALVTEDAEVDFLSALLRGETPATARNPGRLELFIMGSNRWRFENEWPLARTQWTPLYLGSGGRANSAAGDGWLSRQPVGGQETADTFTYDPSNPVPTIGGRGVGDGGQRNQSEIEARADVLVYTLPELTGDLEATGPVTVVLHAASSAPDTDFTVRLADVFPDGRSFSVCDGILRARFRNGVDREPELLVPGTVYELTIDCDCTAYVFKSGHRIRLQVSSSNFPRFARNLNTGADPATGEEMSPAVQTIFHSVRYPSRLILPVIPV